MVSQDVKANAAVGIDVGMIDTCGEVDFRRLERVIGREVNREEEDASLERTVTLITEKSDSVAFQRCKRKLGGPSLSIAKTKEN